MGSQLNGIDIFCVCRGLFQLPDRWGNYYVSVQARGQLRSYSAFQLSVGGL